MASSSEQTTTKQKVGLNRRTLIRTGTHVAWSRPAVAMVSPTPRSRQVAWRRLTLGNPERGGCKEFPPAGTLSCRLFRSLTQVRRTAPGFRSSLRYPMDL